MQNVLCNVKVNIGIRKQVPEATCKFCVSKIYMHLGAGVPCLLSLREYNKNSFGLSGIYEGTYSHLESRVRWCEQEEITIN